MENKIRQHIEALFASAPKTAKAKEVREDMIVNVIERYHDYLAQGKSEDEAYRAAIGGIGDVSELLASLKRDASSSAQENFTAPQQDAYAAPQQAAPAPRKGLSTGAIVAIVLCSTLLLLTIIGGIIAVNVTSAVFSGNGVLSKVVGWATENSSNSHFSASFEFNDDSGFDSAYSESGNYSVNSAEVKTLNVYWVSGEVNIETSPAGSNEITFSETSFSSISSEKALRYKLSDSALTIRCCSSDIWKRIDWANVLNNNILPSKTLTVYIPENMQQLVKINIGSVSNNVSVKDLSVEELYVDIVSGDSVFTGLTADTVEVNGVSGRVNASGCTVSSFDSNVVSGIATINGSFEKLSLNSVSGDVEIDLVSAPESINVDTVSGSITVSGCSAFGFDADFDSVSGKVSSKLALSIDDKHYIFGDGNVDMSFGTVSGNLTLE